MTGRRRVLAAASAAMVAACAWWAPLRAIGGATGATPSSTASIRAMLDQYCVSCHGERLRTAGLSLESIDPARISEQAEVWEKVAAKLRTGAMPPARLPRPDESTLNGIAAAIELSLDEAAARHPDPGRPAIHRMNRVEYSNAVRDLLAIEIAGDAMLPGDSQGFGFDNNADLLTMSPVLMDRYMLAARKIARLAIGDSGMRPVVETYTVSRLLTQRDRMSEDLPFGSRGGLSVRHHFPLDAEYIVRIRLQGGGLRERGDQLELRLDGETVKRFAFEAARPLGPAAADAPPPVPIYETRIAVRAGPRVMGAALLKKTVASEGLGPERLPVGSISFRANGVSQIEIDGPYDAQGPGQTPSRQRIFTCRPSGSADERRCASEILTALARRAYRRPVGARDIEPLLGFFERERGEGFDAGIRAALERVLVDPEFLFRIEREPAGVGAATAYRLSDLEMASRLSFFLWSTIPDDELLDVAARGELKDPATLERQVRRLLTDRRSIALVSNFAAQWLYLRNMRAVAPDALQFPEFDDDLRAAFEVETELFIENQLRDDRSVFDLLTADYSYLNERLARHYRVPNIYGSHFRRVTFADPVRGGLLGQGSILTVTSYATRTSPVLRGKWLLENVLGAPPPPPPPDVPALPDNDIAGAALSVRERMEGHRRNPVCASCHARMDPLGFALENFDAIGKWREREENGSAIDPSSTLPDGTTFRGPLELRRLLLDKREQFARTIVEKLLIYALGRGIEFSDRPAIRSIMRTAGAGDYRWSAIMLAIVNSAPFQMRRSAS